MRSTLAVPIPTVGRCAGRARAVAGVVGAVLLLHGALLALLPQRPGPGWHSDAARPLQVRRVAAAVMDVVPAAPVARATAPTQPKKPAARAGRSDGPTPVRFVAAAPPADPDPRPQQAEANAQAPAPASASLAPAEAPEPAPAPAPASEVHPGRDTVPVYATLLPPPASLHYQLKRSRSAGSAELRWRPQAGRYQLSWHGPGQAGWVSSGSLDSHGIAPERYTEGRRGRELRAANFQRDSARITFSGPATEHPLLPGAQDRLSWMLQLPAVLAANPALAAAGAQVSLFVAGTRGDGGVWTFTVAGWESTVLADGSTVAALHLQRPPRGPYDTAVDVWLDPARHHLPVRVLLRTAGAGSGGESSELLLLPVAQPAADGGP